LGKEGAYPTELLGFNVSGFNYKTFNKLLSQKAEVFVTVSHFYSSLIFVGKEGAYPTELDRTLARKY
jgi:hypothetical protein